ncbi:MAG: hypothetical protein NUV63_03640, partial [Gallionella sp.]|nr:hypothetical protein [Gallionella sp.]
GSKREKRLLFPAANPTYGYLLKMAYLIMQLNTRLQPAIRPRIGFRRDIARKGNNSQKHESHETKQVFAEVMKSFEFFVFFVPFVDNCFF